MRWLNVRCLDAPLVAVAWQALFADVFCVRVRAVARVVLFLTVWVIYLGDRLADVRSLDPASEMSARQAFCHRHRRGWPLLVASLALLDAVLVAGFVRPAVLHVGLLIGLACAVYLIANRFADGAWHYLPIKELTIGSLFACGTVAPLIASEVRVGSPFGVAVVLFAGVCALNCIAIASWEHELDARQGKHAIGTLWPSIGAHLPVVALTVAVSSGFAALAGWIPPRLGWCVAGAAAALGGLSGSGSALAMDDRTALADLLLAASALPGFVLQRWAG